MEADKEIQEKLKKLFFILIGKVMLSGKYAILLTGVQVKA